MRSLVGFLFILSFVACIKSAKQETTIELLELGMPHTIDSGYLEKKGAAKYVSFKGSDSLEVYYGTRINSNGEPVPPADNNGYLVKASVAQKEGFKYLIRYTDTCTSGWLTGKPPAETYCDNFGLWVVKVTKGESSKTFLFNCYQLPDSIKELVYSISYSLPTKTHSWCRQLGAYADSLINACFKQLATDTIGIFNPPKGAIRFTAPQVVNEPKP